MGNRGRVDEGHENGGHHPRIVPDAVNTRAGTEDGGGLGHDAGTPICVGHCGPNADTSTQGLAAGVEAVRGPVAVSEGREDSGGAAAQGYPLGGRGEGGAYGGMGGASRGMPGEVASVKMPARGVGRGLDTKEEAMRSWHNMGGVRRNQRAPRRGQNA